MAVGIVVVSHSRALAEAAVALASEMVHKDPPPLEIAAGTPDGGFGTDAAEVMNAIGTVDQGDGVAIFTDLGSAIMSAGSPSSCWTVTPRSTGSSPPPSSRASSPAWSARPWALLSTRWPAMRATRWPPRSRTSARSEKG